MKTSEEVRLTLQHGRSSSLRRRRWIATLGALGLIDGALMALKQFGVIRKLPDVPIKGFDSDAVVGSQAAYALGLPDATLGALNYAATMAFASLVDLPTRPRAKIWRWLLGASVVSGAVGALAYLGDMVFREKKACAYCLPAAAINLAMVPLVLPDLRR